MKRRPTMLLPLGCLLLAGAPATAFVRTASSTGTPVGWQGVCADVHLELTENPGVPHTDLLPMLRRALAHWTEGIDGCTAFRPTISDDAVGPATVELDGRNAVIWRLAGFCDQPGNADENVCLAPEAAAITTIFYIDRPGDPHDGELLEADIVINAAGHELGDPAAGGLDLESVLTHELGHLLGLDHTCYTTLGSSAPLDGRGQPVPYCFPTVELDPSLTEATMFNFIGAGETGKRTPTADEIAGVCAAYADHAGDCSRLATGCGCAGARSEPGIAVGAAALAMLIATTRTRRRAR